MLIQLSDLLIDGDTGRGLYVAKLIDLMGELLKSRNRFLRLHNTAAEHAAAQKVRYSGMECVLVHALSHCLHA